MTGLEGPSAAASYGLSFCQPIDVDAEEENELADEDANASNEELQKLQAQATQQPIADRVNQHVQSEDASQDVSTDLPPAVDVPRAGSLSGIERPEKRRRVSGSNTPPEHSRRPSQEIATPPARPASERASSANTIKAIPEPTSLSLSSQIPQATPLLRQSESSEEQTPVWLSPPTSRQPSRSPNMLRSRPRAKYSRSGSAASYVTANEDVAPSPVQLDSVAEFDYPSGDSSLSNRASQRHSYLSQGPLSPIERTTSKTSLIHHGSSDSPPKLDGNASNTGEEPTTNAPQARRSSKKDAANLDTTKSQKSKARTSTGLVRFDVPEEEDERKRIIKIKLAQLKKRGTFKLSRRMKARAGEIIKMENMLVRCEFTVHKVPDDYTEKDSQSIETTTIERWKEFMCVCRKNADEDCPFVLHFYKTRVIPAVEKTKVKRAWTHEIQLRKSNCRVSLYSPLDKSMAIWYPSRRGHLIFTLQSRSGSSSMEWFTFLQNILGFSRDPVLQINVPDLAVNLRIDKPFEALESTREAAQAAEDDEVAVFRTMQEEQAVASRLIGHCMEMLNKAPDWQAVIKQWQHKYKMGLAWKRYDRLEWVHGANEQKMYGTIGMERSHELELRPKQHYPTEVADRKRDKMQEPPPVEGFLIRLTSQKGANKKFGKLFFKRLYFSTHNQFLVFNRPARADPPPPPRLPMTQDAQVPSAQRIAEKTPLIYAVNPYPLFESNIDWLTPHGRTLAANGTPRTHDLDAFDENQRKLGLLRNCDGLLNLTNVSHVRKIQHGSTPADNDIDSGSDVEFHQPVRDTQQDDGSTKEVDDDRIFELVLKNGIVIRLQAYNKATKREWMNRLHDLIRYWNLRTAADINLYKIVRAENADRLKIDETTEALVGQYANKWEVSNSAASPELYNMCNIACCRSISMSGHLYHKGHHHGAFTRMLCIMSHGKLLMFADALRSRDGKVLRHIHHERIGTLDLKECYVYSGLATAADTLYAGGTSTFDRAKPGRHGLPRIWLDDGWSSSDEDSSTCFVIWHGKKSGWFRSQDDAITQHQHSDLGSNTHKGPGTEGGTKTRQRLRRVRKLGKEGKSMVFRARSRAERDHWVLSVAMEIERLQTGEDVRLIGQEVKR